MRNEEKGVIFNIEGSWYFKTVVLKPLLALTSPFPLRFLDESSS